MSSICLVQVHSVSTGGPPSIMSISLLVGSGAGLPVALSKSESPEVRGSEFGFHSGS
jgi:hypothetical protein